ncbi:DUF6538 domain-containing protein [Diaphorobacter limosus]|uniref:DUF6538 domain-containing protein n=1 Tax=Diaphorobacter limosus TaxID=3036128 RepID=A0ABZ0JA80_9BURK|nr:DUF6538 domain-containing protein [Diaphorobacter sp. Y-1]WOO34024.1 DUF6538 domain-containing protein [Diaphorobacter sp. Y-1]
MTRFPGVLRRPDSISYQFGLRAPKDLQAHFPSGWAIRASLNTADLREANAKAKALQAEWSARFEALRTGKPRPIDMPVLRRRLFEQWERAIARLDETYSRVPGKDRETRAHGLQCQIDELRQCLSKGVLPEWLEDGAQKYGDATAPEIVTEYGGHQLMLLEVMHEALTDERRTFPLRVQYTRQRRDVMGLNAAPALHAPPDSQAPQQPATAANGKKIGDHGIAGMYEPRRTKGFQMLKIAAVIFAPCRPPLSAARTFAVKTAGHWYQCAGPAWTAVTMAATASAGSATKVQDGDGGLQRAAAFLEGAQQAQTLDKRSASW